MKKIPRKFYNATEAAEYLGVTRQRFYVVKEKYKIKPSKKEYNMFFYAALDLAKVRKLLDNWKGHRA